MRIALLFFTLLTSFGTPLPCDNNCNEWKLKNEEGNYKMYMRECDDSPIKEIKLTDKFAGEFTRLIRVMTDIETNKKISESCTEARQLKQIDKQTALQYFYYKMPIGVKDRDVISKITIKATDSTFSFITEAVDNNLVPSKNGSIRITNARSSWFFKKTFSGTIEMEYMAFADPNGSIPAWIINSLSRREARAGIEKLKKLVHG